MNYYLGTYTRTHICTPIAHTVYANSATCQPYNGKQTHYQREATRQGKWELRNLRKLKKKKSLLIWYPKAELNVAQTITNNVEVAMP